MGEGKGEREWAGWAGLRKEKRFSFYELCLKGIEMNSKDNREEFAMGSCSPNSNKTQTKIQLKNIGILLRVILYECTNYR